MSVSADSLDKLSEKIDEAKRSIRAAASESEAELKAKVDEARKNDAAHRKEMGDHFDRSRYVGMHGDPIGPQAGPGRTD